MAITPVKARGKKTDAETGAEVIDAGGVTVLQGGMREYTQLEDAVRDLLVAARSEQTNRLAMARIVRSIDRLELYKQANVPTFKAYLPILLERTAQVGWGSATSIKRYLMLYRLYVEQLQLNDEGVIKAVSHLIVLHRIADLNRKTGELQDPEKPGKVGPVQFEDLTRLVMWLRDPQPTSPEFAVSVNAMRMKLLDGKPVEAEEAVAVLTANGLGQQAATYRELMGVDVSIPIGGWAVGNTEAIVERVTAQEAEDEEEESAAPLTQVFVGYVTADQTIFVERIEWRDGDAVVTQVPVGKTYSTEMAKKVFGKNKAEIAGVDGETPEEGGEDE